MIDRTRPRISTSIISLSLFGEMDRADLSSTLIELLLFSLFLLWNSLIVRLSVQAGSQSWELGAGKQLFEQIFFSFSTLLLSWHISPEV